MISQDGTAELISRKDPNFRSEHREIPPHELSGDQHDEGSLLMSMSPTKKANFLLTVTTIMKTTIGGGIISLPFTVSRLGMVMSVVMFIAFGLVNVLSSVLLLKAKNLSGHSNFSTILYSIWTTKFSKLFGSLIIFLDDIGICIMELIILKLSIRKIAQDISGDDDIIDNWYLQEYFLVILVALIEMPLTLFKKIEKLKIFSLLGVAGIVLFMISIVIHFIIKKVEGYEAPEMDWWPRDWIHAFGVMPNIILAYAFQMNYFPIYKGLKNSTDSKMNWASGAGTLACGVCYCVVGFVGYALYGHNAQANFLQSISYNDTNHFVFFVLNTGYLLSLLFSFAILFFGCRNNFIAMINLALTAKQYTPKYFNQEEDDANFIQVDASPGEDRAALKRKKNLFFYIYTGVIYFVIIVLAYLLDDIEVILNFLGAICENMLLVVFPCLFYFVLVDRNNKPRKILYYFSIGLLGFIVPFSIWTIVAEYLGDQHEPHQI